jgi:2-keto-4-pentenoate hydratase/2-oxohepta-3-ene-1,7-dioic acid hydratase in catechol pathway
MRKFYRVMHGGTPRHIVEDNGRWHLLEGDLFGRYALGAELSAEMGVTISGEPNGGRSTFLPPVLPSKLVCIGLNYKDHAAEQGKPLPKEPLMFIKPSTAVIGPGDAIVVPDGIGRVDHEAELGVVIGRAARNVGEADAAQYVLGLICVNDVTARGLQQKGVQYTHAKGFDTFAPIGPCVAADLDYHAAEGIGVEGWVNGERRQRSTTAQLVFSIDYLIAYISRVMTLLPGDIVATGTPSGIGPLAPGDSVTITVAGVGELTNSVRGERP